VLKVEEHHPHHHRADHAGKRRGQAVAQTDGERMDSGLAVRKLGGVRLLSVAEQRTDHAEHLEERDGVEDDVRVVAKTFELALGAGAEQAIGTPVEETREAADSDGRGEDDHGDRERSARDAPRESRDCERRERECRSGGDAEPAQEERPAGGRQRDFRARQRPQRHRLLDRCVFDEFWIVHSLSLPRVARAKRSKRLSGCGYRPGHVAEPVRPSRAAAVGGVEIRLLQEHGRVP
jgi:hypothetical protein